MMRPPLVATPPAAMPAVTAPTSRPSSPRSPPVVAQLGTEGQQPDDQHRDMATSGLGGDAGGQAEASHGQPGQTSGGDARLDDPSACVDSSCSKPPQRPEDPTTMVAIGPPDDRNNPEGDQEGDETDSYERISRQPLDQQLLFIDGLLRFQEAQLQIIFDLPYDIDAQAESVRRHVVDSLNFINNVLLPQAEGTPQSAEAAALKAKAEGLLRRIDDDLPVLSAMTGPMAQAAAEQSVMDQVLDLMEGEVNGLVAAGDRVGLEAILREFEGAVAEFRRKEWHEQQVRALELRDRVQAALDNLQNPMDMVDPRVLLPPTGGHTGLTDQQQRALQQHPGPPLAEPNPQDLQLPGHTGLSDQQQRALQQHPGPPLAEPNLQDLQLPGAPLTGEQPAAHTHLATASDGAASDQATTTSWSSYLKAGLGAGGGAVLAVAALILLAGCGRGCGPACYAVLAPVLSRLGLTSARPEPVYGPEHG
jgi:hypothetical protein